MADWLSENWTQLIAAISLLMFVGTIAILPWLATLVPEDYLLRAAPRNHDRPHSLRHWLGKILKNLAATILILLGVIMLVLPGQGLLTLAIGIMLLDFPGKRHLEHRLIAREQVLRGLNWLRRRRGYPPIRPPDANREAR